MAVTGLIDRMLGKGLAPASFLTRFGGKNSVALTRGGGNLIDGVQLGSQGNGADTTEDTLFTYSLPAGALDIVGRELYIFAYGSVTATSATKTVKLYFGSQAVTVANYTTTQTGAWVATMSVFKTGSSTQHIVTQFDAAGSSTTRNVSPITNSAESDTAAIVIKVTGQSTVGTANTVVCNGLIIAAYN